ncbi:hypothetical protein BFAG_04624 [Bacteroides fragilis 3_1_12]|uniref:Transmembrane protein n=1 Tax=Bacteroides fragilis 3_1_12 TaxID=457424 RepID=A0ABN0BSI6_BACFG|nr:hypothetical protein BFAG_04624 [Bacteroides fragilis 3_1_12]
MHTTGGWKWTEVTFIRFPYFNNHQFYGFCVALYLFIGIVDSFMYTYLCGSLIFNINLMPLNV